MKCYDGSTPANISSLDLREYLMPTLRGALVSFPLPTAVAWNVGLRRILRQSSVGKRYVGLAMLIFMVAGEIGASCAVRLLKQVTTFCNKPNRGFYHIHGDFKVMKLSSSSSL